VTGGTTLVVVAGGETRQDSVAAALRALPAEVDVVLVHDAARPLAPSDLVDAVAATVRSGASAVVPGVAVADTVKQVDPAGRVEATLDRSVLRAIQTPQGFRRDVLEAAHARASSVATDDAGLVEALGETVLVVAGSEEAFKVTRPIDLLMAEAVLARRRAGGAA
jgi:2-C-methyl-D-erythritol 4-phosphate cytidylyltransferase